MRESADNRLEFDFFGVKCDLVVPTTEDVDHFRYYFSHFEGHVGKPDIEIRLSSTDSRRSFVSALLDSDTEKQIHIRTSAEKWVLYEKFDVRSSRPTPFPPFSFSPLSERLRVIHAASLVNPVGSSVVLLGGSFSGKSVVTLELLKRGWSFQSDDLTILAVDSLETLAFPRPIGIRENTFELLPWLANYRVEEFGRRFWVGNQWTHMVSATDLFPDCLTTKAQFGAMLSLKNGPSFQRCVVTEDHSLEMDQISDLPWLRGSQLPKELNDVSFYRAEFCIERHSMDLADLLQETLSEL